MDSAISRLRLTGAGLGIFVLVADQISKWWIVETVMARPQVIEITPFFNLVMVWNRGVTFGFFGAGGETTRWILIGLTLVIVVILGVWFMRTARMLVGAALGLVVGGALGNVVDRFHYGAVADFLDFHAFGWHWPAFNLADSAIFVGVLGLLIDAFLNGQE